MATQRPVTPSAGGYGSIPTPTDPSHLNRGYGANSHLGHSGVEDFATTPANPVESSPLSQSLGRHESVASRFEENFDARTRGSSVIGDGDRDLPARSHSRASTTTGTPTRSGTLKKRASVKRSGSLKRSGSRRSVRAGSIKGVNVIDDDEQHDGAKHNSIFYTPVPTSGSPTEILANRFQGMAPPVLCFVMHPQSPVPIY